MEDKEQLWRDWAQVLQRWKMQTWAAAMLEASGPLKILFAQFIYIGQPLLGQVVPKGHLNLLAGLLENPSEGQAFVNYLREGTFSEPH